MPDEKIKPSEFRETGLFLDIPFEDYSLWPGLRKTRLWTAYKLTPAHYKTALDAPPKDTEALRKGHAGHTLLLEPDKFDQLYTVLSETYPTPKGDKPWHGGAKYCRDFIAEIRALGKTPLTTAEAEAARAAADAVRRSKYFLRLLEGSDVEASIQWHDGLGGTGRLMKARLDILNRHSGFACDFKTTRCASPGSFGRDAYNYGYHFQCAQYWDGVATLFGEDEIDVFYLIAAETDPPYAVKIHEINSESEALAIGRAQYRATVKLIHDCMDEDIWPGYGDEPCDLVLPGYAGMELQG